MNIKSFKAAMRNSLILTTFFFTLLITPIFGQKDVSKSNFESVFRNNNAINIYEGNVIYGQEGDAIRISGSANPGDSIIVLLGGKEYNPTLDKYNNWFVLFSITNFDKEEYLIEINTINDEKNYTISNTLNLIIAEDPETPNLNKGYVPIEENDKTKANFKIIVIIIEIIIIVVGLFLLSPKIYKIFTKRITKLRRTIKKKNASKEK